MVPMPDGVRLATTVCFPQGHGPWPVLLIRTPYGRGSCEEHSDVTGIGIVAVTQDVRGRFDSEGQDVGFFADREDGQATLDWIAAQSWSNGRVATFGGSAEGIVQYLMAPGAPDVLRCQHIGVATPDIYAHAVFQGGAYRYELAETWLEETDSTHLIEPFRAHHLNTSYWDPVQITEDYADVHVPAVHEGGWYDIFARGTVDAFLGYQNQGGEGAAGQQHLIMGPWPHAGYTTEVGELTFPDADREDYDIWMWLADCPLDESGDMSTVAAWPAVHYYTMGAVGEANAPGNEWRDADSWPPEGVVDVPIYLHPGNSLDTEPPEADGGGDTFTYDPNDPSPTLGGANLFIDDGARDQRSVEARDDVVVYSSPPLDEPIEVTGDLRAQIWITTDVPDTDIVVRLTDVYPDGRSMLVADGIMRARYHNSPDFTSEQLLEPGVPVLLTLDLGPTSIIFNTGHRIRVSVTSSNAPRFLPNPNTGAMYLEEGAGGQIAHTTILHNADYPSTIILPIRLEDAQDTAATHDEISIQDVMVPMPDGIRLATTIYLPAGEGPWPTVLERTPDGRELEHEMGLEAAEAGIAFVVQDPRVPFESESKDAIWFTDREDGQATVAWIAAQPWSNGRVMTLGASTNGITQYMLAPGAPEALRCQWIEIATPDVYRAFFQGGVFREAMGSQWVREGGSGPMIEVFRAHYLNDDYWDPAQIVGDYADVDVSAFHIGGWYDIFAREIVAAFTGYQNEGGDGAAGRQHLIMGPWTHDLYEPVVGELFYPDSALAFDDIVDAFILACLLDEEQAWDAVDDLPAVQYFTMGAVGEEDAPGNEWQDADRWPPEGVVDVPLYLQPGNSLDVEPPDTGGGGDTFAYDPADPAPTLGGTSPFLPDGPFDQRSIEARDDVIIYTTAVLEEPVEVTGNLYARIWIATDVPDTDIVVRLTDVYPEGHSMLVAGGIFRARYRDCPDFSCEAFLESGEPVLLTVDLGPTSIVFNAGHRIRISITSSNAPRFSPNPNTGAMYLEEGAGGQTAHTTILHSADYPSTIILPVR